MRIGKFAAAFRREGEKRAGAALDVDPTVLARRPGQVIELVQLLLAGFDRLSERYTHPCDVCDGEVASSARLRICWIIGLAVIVRAIFWTVRPPDMAIFLEPWFAHIVRFGPVGAFAHPFSNYEPAYLYLLALGSVAAGLLTPMTIIKIISVGGTLFLTLAFADLL